ncbi:nucleotidyltransferase domain-containing protein [candidate division KSB1 bacterium]|nr:nucleotidyltransferase domain-containing protein [candidate division KSB1 bacterium]
MDKINAIKLSIRYLKRIRANNIKFSDAWLFGSYANGVQDANSDIDLAIVLEDSEKKSFDTEVRLMVIREGEETLIEPHAFTKEEFDVNIPIVNQIMRNGERIKI